MIKKLLFLIIPFLALNVHAQTISIVGSGVNGWPPTNGPEITLNTTDNTNYTISNLAISSGEVKFRQDLDWTINWGGTSFPNGTGTQDGANIPTQAGIYTVNFNRATGVYSFVGSVVYPTISLIGDALSGWSTDVIMNTTDGTTYSLNGYTFNSGEAKFRQDTSWDTNWGTNDQSSCFPLGTGIPNAPLNLIIPAGTYNVTFNRNTGSYAFNYVAIGLIGSATAGDWSTETAMNTADGVVYSLSGISLNVGEVKFRQNNSWDANWGSNDLSNSFPSGTGIFNSEQNISVPNGGIYDVTFNRNTLEYSFVTSLSVNQNSLKSFKVYPNPSKNLWNISSIETISAIELFDITGKLISIIKPNDFTSTVDASGLRKGLYFAKITSLHSQQTLKLIKE